MLDAQKVYHYFSLFSDLEGEAAAPYHPFCDAAAGEVTRRLRTGADIEAGMDRLCMAAAAMACGDCLELWGAGGSSAADEVRVGDITLKSASGTAASQADSQALSQHFLSRVADLLEPPFVLGRTGGGS